jgi:hypothetical protein
LPEGKRIVARRSVGNERRKKCGHFSGFSEWKSIMLEQVVKGHSYNDPRDIGWA